MSCFLTPRSKCFLVWLLQVAKKQGIVSLKCFYEKSQLTNEMLSYANEKLSSKVTVTNLSGKTVIIHQRRSQLKVVNICHIYPGECEVINWHNEYLSRRIKWI